MQGTNREQNNQVRAVGGPMLIGYFALFVLVGVIGIWSVQARLEGAVIASGVIQVENNRQVLQHPQGGVVGELLARDGDIVKAGDIVLRLDDTHLRSELTIITKQLFELGAQKGRLLAEQIGANQITFDKKLVNTARTSVEIALLLDSQERLFQARNLSLQQEDMQISIQVDQKINQIDGVAAQLSATETQYHLLTAEITKLQPLLDKGLVQTSRVLALRREAAKLLGDIGMFTSNISQLKDDIAGLQIRKLRLQSQRRQEAMSGLREIAGQEIELVERELALHVTLLKMELRTPVSGVIYGSTVFASQSVVSPADPIMFVIPQNRPLIVSVRIDIIHIDQVHIGQEVALRFSAFDQRTTPEILGMVSKVSADAYTDQQTGQTYYEAEVQPNEHEMKKLTGLEMLPGMPVETFIKTAERSPLSFLVQPIAHYFNRALREA